MSLPRDLAAAKLVYPPVWVIYDRPSDFPEEFVVRIHYGLFPDPQCWRAPTLIEAREIAVEQGASFRLDRFDGDMPAIVECWL